jgi:HPt (histidine-containing phosphotransfer) domain-containing protein
MVAEVRSPQTPLFDLDHLSRYTGADLDLQAELLGLMQEQAQRCLGLMHHAHDRSAWRTATHTLKGAARGVGAFALADLCEQVEEMPQASWSGASLAVARLIDETHTAIQTTLATDH